MTISMPILNLPLATTTVVAAAAAAAATMLSNKIDIFVNEVKINMTYCMHQRQVTLHRHRKVFIIVIMVVIIIMIIITMIMITRPRMAIRLLHMKMCTNR